MTVILWKTVPQPVELRRVIDSAPACTCHIPSSSRFGRYDVNPRQIILVDGSSEWRHTDDGSPAYTHHTHVEIASNDCDGPHQRSYVDLPHPAVESTSEFDHWMGEVRYLPNPAVYGEGEMTLTHHDDGTYSGTWSARTEEGREYKGITLCRDPHCAYARSSQRDYYAEAAGY